MTMFAPSELFHRIFHASPVAMVVSSLEDGRCIDINDACLALVGRQRDYYVGNNDRDLCPININQPERGEPGWSKGGGVRHIYRLQTGLGEIKEVIATSQLAEWDGNRYTITFIQDLSSFRRTQNALRQSESGFHLFFDNVPVPILVFDLQTAAILDANERAVEQYGYEKQTLRGMNMLDLHPQADRAAFMRFIKAQSTELEHVGLKSHMKRDESLITVDTTSYAFELDGRWVRLAMLPDVTEKIALQRSLRTGEEYQEIVAEVISDAIWDYDIARDALKFSSGLRTMFGYETRGVLPLQWWESHIHPGNRDSVQESFAAALAGEESFWQTQYQFRRQNGTYAYVLDRGYILRDANGQAVRCIGTMVDITKQVKLRTAAEAAAQRERTRLASDLHDAVTQSLYSLSLMAEVAHRQAAANERRAAIESVDRLGELAQQSLKEMYLLVYENQPAALERDGLAGALSARLDAVERRAGVAARLNVVLETPPANNVQTQLYWVAQEALNNALKHSQATTVDVRIQSQQGVVEMEVRDNGVGFDLDQARRSAGLGLANIENRMRKLGGEAEILTTMGEGTTVRVRLDQSGGSRGR